MNEINKKWRQGTKLFLSDSIIHGLWFIVGISDSPGEKWYVIKIEDLSCLTLHMPVLQIHGPLKCCKENFRSIKIPDKMQTSLHLTDICQ